MSQRLSPGSSRQCTPHTSLYLEMFENSSSAISLVFTLISMQAGVSLRLSSPELCAVVGTHTKDTLLAPWRLTGMPLVSKMFNRMLPASATRLSYYIRWPKNRTATVLQSCSSNDNTSVSIQNKCFIFFNSKTTVTFYVCCDYYHDITIK